MGWFKERSDIPDHPRREPEIDLPVELGSVEQMFRNCADFDKREILMGSTGITGTLCWLNGMVKMERVSEYLICPLSRMPEGEKGSLADWIRQGGVWSMTAQKPKDMDEVCQKLVEGSVVLFWKREALLFLLPTEEKRSISPPVVENVVKGAKDAFVESVRTNTSLIRRRIRTPRLRIEEQLVGRQSLTPVDLLYIDGLTNMALVDQLRHRIAQIDIDGVMTTGNLEEYLVDNGWTAFPQMLFTERPDRLCGGLLEGRAAILVEGLPCGWLSPGNLSQFLRAPQDRAYNYLTVTALTILRYFCMIVTLFLPGAYVAVANFHYEMIPTELILSIVASKEDVPFPTGVEVLGLLIAFEILQEAGLRLPQTIGQTVSIIGGLVVGQSAVEAKIISPVVVIVVAVAGITGYTMPNQDFSNAIRLWRFGVTIAAALAGLFGLMAAGLALIIHLSRLETFGVPYLTPFAGEGGRSDVGSVLTRGPLRTEKIRPWYLKAMNKRNQK